jgi:hypothetical protein
MTRRPDDVCRRCGKRRHDHSGAGTTPDVERCPGTNVAVHADDFDPTPAASPEGGHPGYLKLLDEMRALHVRKAADYGRAVDPLANVRAAADFGIPAWVGVMVRANDKMHRIKSFLQNGSLKNESVEDSLMDLAAYALIALVLYREGADGPHPEGGGR